MNETRAFPSPTKALDPGRRVEVKAPGSLGDEVDILDLLRTLWRGKWIIGAVATVVVLLGGYYAIFMATPFYRASATVVLDSREEQIVDIENVMSGLSGDQATINTEVEVLRSRGLASQLVDRLNLLEDAEFNPTLQPKPWISLGTVLRMIDPTRGSRTLTEQEIRDATIDNVLDVVSIANVRQSYVFRITVNTMSAAKSAAMANMLAQVYIDEQLQVKFNATDTATEWLATRVTELREELEAAETAVKDFNASTELISPAGLEILNRQMKDLRERLAEARSQQALISLQTETLGTALVIGDAALAAETMDDPTLVRFAENGTNGEVFETYVTGLIARTETETARIGAQIAALEASSAKLESQIESQSEDLVLLQQLQREAEASGTIYAHFLSRLKETSVQRGIQQPDSRILSQAVVPRQPAEPNKPLILALAGMFGLLLGSALVLAREASKNTFRSSEELASYTQHPVIGTIPKIPVRKRGRMIDYIISKPTSNAAEAVRNLRTSLMLSNVDEPPQVILSTSSVPSEGKTTQSILLAQNFAALGRKVLLVEGDMRRRVFEQYFDIKSKEGFHSLVTVLTGGVSLEQAVAHDATLGVDVLVSDKSSVNAADLYSSTKFSELLAAMRSQYDTVIIDTPPVLVVPDARVIAPQVDAVMYTVRWDYTHKGQVREGIRMLESVGVRVNGLVLGQVDPKGLRRYGYTQYGGYGYGANGGYRGYYEN